MIISPEYQKVFDRWFSENGDKTHRLNYNLNQNSIVLDIGAYEGNWANDIYNRFKCNIQLYQPIDGFYKECLSRFNNVKHKVISHNYGVGGYARNEMFSIGNDASGINFNSDIKQQVRILAIKDVISSACQNHKVNKIDLMKINIEGGEYELLDALLNAELETKVDNIQVQFHKFVKDHQQKYKCIVDRLSDTHYLTYSFPFVWENWKRK